MEAYTSQLAKIVVLQFLHAAGINHCSQSVVDTLAMVCCNYIKEIGIRTKTLTNHAERTDSNFHDIMGALSTFGLGPKHLLNYTQSTEPLHFIKSVPTIPLPSPVYLEYPIYPASRAVWTADVSLPTIHQEPLSFTPPPSPSEEEEEPIEEDQHISSYVPTWLPSFPPDFTYVESNLYGIPVIDQVEARRHQLEESQKIHAALKNLSSYDSKFSFLFKQDNPMDHLTERETNPRVFEVAPELKNWLQLPIYTDDNPSIVPVESEFPGAEIFCFMSVKYSPLDDFNVFDELEYMPIPVPVVQIPPPVPPNESGDITRKRNMLVTIENATEDTPID
ncbi:hypothetical protein GEMRC1_004485 [Eukaryota sp. GEM-RC1]